MDHVPQASAGVREIFSAFSNSEARYFDEAPSEKTVEAFSVGTSYRAVSKDIVESLRSFAWKVVVGLDIRYVFGLPGALLRVRASQGPVG